MINCKRQYHTEESTYWLPKDQDEQSRLFVQQSAYKKLFGGPIPSNVRDFLNSEEELSVLDVGCGPGFWIMDMMGSYPKCTYYGCDLVDTASGNAASNGFLFSQGDITKGLPYADNTFDFIHMRLVICGILEKDWPKAIKELIRVTKPGGLIQCVEIDLILPEGKPYPFCKFFNAIKTMCTMLGQNPRIAHDLERLFRETKDVSVFQSDYLSFNFAHDTPISKAFAQNYVCLSTSMMQNLKPILNIKTDEEATEFVKEMEATLPYTDCLVGNASIVVQKLRG